MADYDSAVQVYLSTAGFQKEGHVGFELFQQAQAVQENPALDPKQLAIVYAFPEDKLDWRNPDNWWDYLPSVGHTVSKQFYMDQFNNLAIDTLGENTFKTLLLNIWSNSHGDGWISTYDWNACKEPFDETSLHGCKATMGIDLSRKFDLSSIVLLVEKEDKLYIVPRFFCCEQGLEQKCKHDGFPYTLHAKNPKENLCVIPGEIIDPAYIRKQIIQDHIDFKIQDCGYDAHFFSDETRQILEYQNGINMVEVKQNYQVMSAPTLQLERWIRGRKIHHNDNKVMSWCIEAARLKMNGQLAMLDSRASRARIDGVQALAIAIQRKLDAPSFQGRNPLVLL